ncbi:hypothetical protein [Micromonospora sp. CPCC 206061]|uniref:hypothetical protein n=1 Tax=Micromonospora sp. CPCC 206061 TaxID=3122410 RepID=UPI002FF1DB31
MVEHVFANQWMREVALKKLRDKLVPWPNDGDMLINPCGKDVGWNNTATCYCVPVSGNVEKDIARFHCHTSQLVGGIPVNEGETVAQERVIEDILGSNE